MSNSRFLSITSKSYLYNFSRNIFSGKSQCSSICNTDFDCQWGQVCENGMCAKNDEVHWTCDGAFNEPQETCKRKPEKDIKKLEISTQFFAFNSWEPLLGVDFSHL